MNKQNNGGNAPSNLPHGDFGDENEKRDDVDSSYSEYSSNQNTVNIPEPKDKKDDSGKTWLKVLAVIALVIILLAGLYGTSRVIANLPNAARSIASGFISVTSQMFGPDDEDIIEEEEEDVSEEEDASEEEEDASDDTDQEDTTSQTNTETQTTQRTEYRIVNRGGGSTVSDPNGDVDLEVEILAVGIMDRRGMKFIEKSVFDEDDLIAIKFKVTNIGTKTSDGWFYRADLPTEDPFVYDSEEQVGLEPGERIEFTLAFDQLDENGGDIDIEADPGRDLDDITHSNNRVTVELEVDDSAVRPMY